MSLQNMIDQKGIKKNKIAEMLGISRSTLWKKINGQLSFTVEEKKKLSSIFQVTLEELKDEIYNS